MVGVPFGLNDRGYKAQVRNLLRTDTPKSTWFLALMTAV